MLWEPQWADILSSESAAELPGYMSQFVFKHWIGFKHHDLVTSWLYWGIPGHNL